MGIMAGNRGGRGGFSGNRLSLLLVLGLVSLVLHYSGNPHPWQAFKHDVLGIFGVKTERPDERRNPGGGGSDDEASDSRQGPSGGGGGVSDPNQEGADVLEPFLPAHAADAQIVRHKAYILQYEEQYEEARWVIHRVLGRGGNAKRSPRFMPDPLVQTRSALPSDYTNSGYDRGHMAPAGDFKYSQELTTETFYMSNMSPQDHELNIGLWNDIEDQVRRWAKRYGPLVVVTGPVLVPGLTTIGHTSQVAVPERYFKIAYDPARQKAIAFLVENRGYTNTPIRELVVSIDDVEQATGVDFFAALPDAVEKSVESQREADDWF